MANEYVTIAELKTALSLASETYADADLSASAEAASRAVDGYCGTQFYLSPSEDRRYTPVSEEYVRIDEATNVSSVVASETTLIAGADYAQIGTPIDVLRSLNGFRFPRGVVNGVVVTGEFGWPAPPADVKRATLIMAARIFKRSREAPLGVVGFDLEGVSVRLPSVDPDVRTLLQPYTRSGMIE
jgi:hypothetical protein